MKLLGLMTLAGAVTLAGPVVVAQTTATSDKPAKMTPALERLGLPLPVDETGLLERLHHANQLGIQLAKMEGEDPEPADQAVRADDRERAHQR